MDDTKVREDEFQDEALMEGGEDQPEISSDLIRGHINTIILRTLYDEDKYGYDIMEEIERKSCGMYKLKPPTLYSALKRLEALGYVDSYAGDVSNGGRRKYFHLTEAGREVARRNLSEWEFSRAVIDNLILEGDNHYDFSFIADKKVELDELKRSLSARESALAEERNALLALKNELQRERSTLATKNADLDSMKVDLGDVNAKIASQREEIEAKDLALYEKQAELDNKEAALQEKQLQLTQARNTIDIIQKELNTASSRLSDYEAQIQLREEELKETEESLMSLQKEYSAIRLDFLKLKEHKTVDQDQLDQIEALQAQLFDKETRLSDTEKELQNAKIDLEKRETALVAAQLELSEKTAEYYELFSKVTSEKLRLENERADFENEKSTATDNEELSVLRNDYNQLKTSLEEKNDAFVNLQNVLSAQEESIRVFQDALQKKAQEADDANEKLTALEEAVNVKTAESESLRARLQEKTEEADGLSLSVADLKERLNTLQGFKNEEAEDLILREQQLTDSLTMLELEKEALFTEKSSLQDKIEQFEQQKRQLEDQQAALNTRESEFLQKEYELNQRQLSFGQDQTRTTADKESFAREQAAFAEQQEILRRQQEQIRYEQELLQQQKIEITTRAEQLNQQQIDYLSRQHAFTLQKFEYEDKYAAQSAQIQHFTEMQASFEAEKAAFNEEKEKFELSVKTLEDEKAAMQADKHFDRQTIDSLTAKNDAAEREIARLKAANTELEMRINESAATQRRFGMQSPALSAGYPYAGTDDLQRKAAQDGIRLNSRTSCSPRAVSPFSTQKNAVYFNKGATLFKTALLTFCFLLIECIIVFFMKETLKVSVYYPLIPMIAGLLAFGICTILYASGYQANARLNKKSSAYIFSGVILFIVGAIIASMIAVYCKAPLADAMTLLKFIVIPAVFMTNLILFPTFYHFLAIANENKESEEE